MVPCVRADMMTAISTRWMMEGTPRLAKRFTIFNLRILQYLSVTLNGKWYLSLCRLFVYLLLDWKLDFILITLACLGESWNFCWSVSLWYRKYMFISRYIYIYLINQLLHRQCLVRILFTLCNSSIKTRKKHFPWSNLHFFVQSYCVVSEI